MIAIVTGAPGWLGTTLVNRLIGRPVRCLVEAGADSSELARGGAEIVNGDIRSAESLARLFEGAKGGTVFHAAGVIHPSRGVKQFYEVNVQGTQNLLAAAQKAGVRRFVHVSSNSPIGTNPSADHVFDESAPYHPYMHYGRSKMLAEQAVKAAADLETVIIRPPWFYGPNQPARQSLFFTMIRTGKVPLVGSGENRRSMAYVDNICQGLLLCESVTAARGQTYWIADRRPYTMNEIISTIEDVMEKDFGIVPARKRMKLPSLASEVAWLADKSLQGLGLYQQKLHVLSEMNKTIACSVAKAERELGYKPDIELREGMRRSMQWMKERGQTF
jgi:nucleoside-diphosphate-sugar epimerase